MDDLTSVIQQTLENSGVLSNVRGRLRAEVFKALDDRSVERPKLPSDNLLINELIREYLLYNNHHHTLAVLMQETRQPQAPLDRDFLSSELHLKLPDKGREVPLLYGVVSHFTDQHSNNCNEVNEDEDSDDVELKQPQVTIIKK